MRSVLIAALVAALALPVAAPGAAAGADLVVCRRDTRARLKEAFRAQPRTLRARLVLLRRCRHLAIQPAVDAAPDGARVLILPGVYRPGLVDLVGRSRLSLLGMGRRARDVILRGDRHADAVVRAAGGHDLGVANLTVEEGAASDIDIAGTRAFALHRLVVRWSGGDGVRIEAGASGAADGVEAYGNGDSGVVVRAACGAADLGHINAYGNVVGVSGTVRLHDSRLAGNATGALIGFPGCAMLARDAVTANNAALFAPDRQRYCAAVPFAARPQQLVCPRRLVPAGTGVYLDGANATVVRDSRITANRRAGVRLRWVPAAARGIDDPRRQFDTSNANRFLADVLRGNGADVSWDGEGAGNCWSPAPRGLPACPGASALSTGDPAVQAADVPCAAWDPVRDPRPVGCSWVDVP